LKYTFTESGHRPQTAFCAGSFVPDLADALTRVTGESWNYSRERPEDCGHYSGPWHACTVRRARDGLVINVRRDHYTKPLRGHAAIDWRDSGCGISGPRERHDCSFAHDRDIDHTARHIVRSVVTPHEADLIDLRAKKRQADATAAYVERQLAEIAEMPGCRLNRIGRDETYVTVGQITVSVTPTGYVRIVSGSLSVADLVPLAEHFASMARQLTR